MNKHWFSSLRLFAVLIFCGLGSEGALKGQGSTIRFSNLVPCAGVDVPCYDGSGATFSGSSVFAQLYIGPLGTLEKDLSPIGPAQPFLSAGHWAPANITLLNYPPGFQILTQVRIWDSNGGTLTSFEAAAAAGARVAISPVFPLFLNPIPVPPPPCFVNIVPPPGAQPVWGVPILAVARGAPQTRDWPQIVPDTGGTADWFSVTSAIPGQVVINTDGSAIPTMLSVYTGNIIDPAGMSYVASSSTPVPGRTNEVEVRFQAGANILYLLTVSGKNGTNGPFRLNYSLSTRLDARMTTNKIELSWPADATNFSLQASTTLSTNSWRAITNLASVGTNRLQLGTRSGPRTFYRLGPP